MNATDTEFYRAFAGRVRDHLPTSRSTTPEGSPDMNTTIETSAAPTVPAAFQPAPDAPCERHPWCTERGEHLDCYGPEIGLDADGGSIPVLVGQLHYDGDDNTLCLLYQRCDDWKRHTSADLRAEADLVRAHAARLDALADQYDAVTEAAGTVPQPPAKQGEHYPWCAPVRCRTAPADDGTAFHMHEGPANTVPGRRGEGPRLESLLAADDDSAPSVHLSFRGEGAPYSALEAQALAADLEVFLASLKAQITRLNTNGGLR